MITLCSGCQSAGITATEDTPPSTDPTQLTETTDDPTADPTDTSEPTDESTEPTDDTTEPTETVCSRTIEYFKSHLTPFMRHDEVVGIFGLWDQIGSTLEIRDAKWYLEDDYYIEVYFYPTANKYMAEYLATEPIGETNPDGTPIDEIFYVREWFQHMQAYRAELCKAHPYEVVEVWFDYGDGPFQEG